MDNLPIVPLTLREYEVLLLVYDGLQNKEIARKLLIKHSTVQNHLSNIYSKLDVTSRTEAVRWGIRHGILHH